MIFLTVGTQFQFDRLVKAIDELYDKRFINEEIFGQIGVTSYRPRNFKYAASLDKGMFDDYLKRASVIIGHAGMGTITAALDNNKPLLVMPRFKKHKEIVNDHQVAIAKRFEELGHILAVYHEKDIAAKIGQLKSFTPVLRENQAKAVVNRITRFLDDVSGSKK